MSYDLDFSNPENASNFAWSPDGIFLARAVNTGITIKNLKEDLIIKSTTLPGRIDLMEWSADSSYLACSALTAGLIKVFSVDLPTWHCKIDVGNEDEGVGLEDFVWSPDARNILTTAAHYVQLTVWSISSNLELSTSKDVAHIRDILPIKKYKSFSGGGKFMAIAQFDDNYSTCIGVYTIDTWKKTVSFPVACNDLEEVSWCPNDLAILLRDSSLFCGIYIYSPSGDLLKHFSPDGLALGLVAGVWAPTGQFLGTLNHRNVLRILNGLTYGLLLEEKLEPSLPRNYHRCQQFAEILHDTFGYPAQSTYKRETDVLVIPTITSCLKQKVLVKFSWDSKFLAVTSDSYPTTVWVWEMTEVVLAAVLVHLSDVSDFDWHSHDSILCICTGRDMISLWSPQGNQIKRINCAEIVNPFRCKGVKWNPMQNSIVLTSKDDKLIVCKLTE